MKIRIDEIPEAGLELLFSGEEDILAQALVDLKNPQGVKIDPRLRGHVSLLETENSLFLSGRVEARLHLSCYRCLAEFFVDNEIDLEFVVRREDIEGPRGDQFVESTANEVWTEGPELDLGTLLAQEFLLDVPMKPLCSEDCPGLCPRCGALKGSDQCTCQPDNDVDPRWHVLAGLKEQTSR